MQLSVFLVGKRFYLYLFCFFLADQLLPGCSASKEMRAETASPIFLIPAHYQGSLSIVYDEPCGVKPEVENGSPVYRFPDDGILILQEKENYYNRVGSAYFFVDAAGDRQEIKQVIDRAPGYTTDSKGNKHYEDRGNTTLQSRLQDKPVFIIKGIGVQYVKPLTIVNGEVTNLKEAAFEYTQYGVYKNDAIDTTGLLAHPEEDNLIKDKVRICKEHIAAVAKRTN